MADSEVKKLRSNGQPYKRLPSPDFMLAMKKRSANKKWVSNLSTSHLGIQNNWKDPLLRAIRIRTAHLKPEHRIAKGERSKQQWKNPKIRKRRVKGLLKVFKEGRYTRRITWGRSTYKNICFRSSWEVQFARWCDLNKVEWHYESKRFDLGTTTYCPDFYLPAEDLYIEIKGYIIPRFVEKFNKFQFMFPATKIVMLFLNDLQRLGVING